MHVHDRPKRAEPSNLGAATRREFLKVAVGAAALLASSRTSPAKLIPIPPGIKVMARSGMEPTAENIGFLKQLGITWVNGGTAVAGDANNVERLTKLRQQWEAAGFRVYSGGISVPDMVNVGLNLPGRDQKIEEYANCIRDLGKAGIPYVMQPAGLIGNGIAWRSARIRTARGYLTTECDVSNPDLHANSGTRTYFVKDGLSHGRVFTREEIWENWTYFIKKIGPVAEEAGVRLGIHPDDPPVPILAGVPRILSNFDGLKRALDISNSPNVGVCLCLGCVLEAGPNWGATPVETIKYIAGQKKLFHVHFRNVSSTLPRFHETLIDDGYYNMSQLMKALVEVNYDGTVDPDHCPGMFGQLEVPTVRPLSIPGEPTQPPTPATAGSQVNYGTVYLIGSIQAMLKAAQGG